MANGVRGRRVEAVDRPKLASSYISHPLKTRRQACFRFALHRRLKRALGNEGAVGAAGAGSDDERGANGSRVARTCNRQLSRLTPLHLPRAPASSRPCFFPGLCEGDGNRGNRCRGYSVTRQDAVRRISCSDARPG